MTAKCDVYQIDTPLTQLSYDEEFGYFVAAENVEIYIMEYYSTIKNNDFMKFLGK